MGGIFLLNELEAFMDIDGFVGSADEKAMEAFLYCGVFFEKHATENKEYHDITSNLKNSTGFSVCMNGQVKSDGFGGEGGSNPEALKEAKEGIKEILQNNSKGLVLIGIAGMQYGVYVENMKGKSVIAQSIEPTTQLLTRLLEK